VSRARRYIPKDKTLLIQFLWVRLRCSQHLVCRVSICSMNAMLEGTNFDLFQVKYQPHFCRGNCAADQSQCSATDCSILLDLSLSQGSP
jgi:hypothetical protein